MTMFKSVSMLVNTVRSVDKYLCGFVINTCKQISNLRDFDLRDILYSFAGESGLNRLKLRYNV